MVRRLSVFSEYIGYMPTEQNKMIMMYEHHDDPAPTMAIRTLFKNMTACHGKGTFCAEEKDSLTGVVGFLERFLQQQRFCLKNPRNTACKQVLNGLIRMEAMEDFLLLLKQVKQDSRVKYASVDQKQGSSSLERNQHMALGLRKHIKKGWVIFLVGANHFPIQCLLAEAGINSTGYFAIENRYNNDDREIIQELYSAVKACKTTEEKTCKVLLTCRAGLHTEIVLVNNNFASSVEKANNPFYELHNPSSTKELTSILGELNGGQLSVEEAITEITERRFN